jgi:hypothetical protein
MSLPPNALASYETMLRVAETRAIKIEVKPEDLCELIATDFTPREVA